MMESPPVTKEWIDHLVGRNWELYWAPSSDTTSNSGESATKENHTETNDSPSASKKRRLNEDEEERKVEQQPSSDSFEEDEDEADWYAAKVVKFLQYDQADTSKPIFHVLFVGDEELYIECLTPKSVRPCTRTWVKRTLSLLDNVHSNPSVDIKRPLHEQLPIDTRRLQDEAELASIQLTVDREVPSFTQEIKWKEAPGSDHSFVQRFEHDRMREMLCLIRSQIYLREGLVPATLPQRYASMSDDELTTSEPYVGFLVSCLGLAVKCCVWFDGCYRRLFELHTEAKEHTLLKTDDIRHMYTAGGKETLVNLLALDPTPTGFKRKRRGATSIPSSKVRRTTKSRRRTNSTVSNCVVEEESGAKYLDIEEEDLEAEDFVHGLLERLSVEDGRWFTHSIGRLLTTFLDCVILPVIKWDKQSTSSLGIEEDDQFFSMANPSEVDDSDENETSRISLECIESHIAYQMQDLVLSKFDFEETKQKLENKINSILQFEDECRSAISCITDEVGASPHNSESDGKLVKLASLLEQSNQRSSAVWNISRFGRAPRVLTRDDIQNSCTHRKWFLDLLHAETSRERAQFLNQTITNYLNLPPLPLQKDGSSPVQTDKIEPRVKSLELLLEKNKDFFHSQETLLTERRDSPTLSIPAVETIIGRLQGIGIISMAEEMAVCRKDIMLWLQKAVVLEHRIPAYSDIDRLASDLDELLAGRSAGRLGLAHNLRPMPSADKEIQLFLEVDINAFGSESMERCKTLYSDSKWWKERFETILISLAFYKNNVVPADYIIPLGAKQNLAMVDLKRIEDLLVEYPLLQTSLADEHSCLNTASEECRRWSDDVNRILLADKIPSFSSVLKDIETTNRPDVRPKGIILSPTRQTLDLVLDILRWHSSAKGLRNADGSFDAAQGYHALLEGIEIVEMFSKSQPSSDLERYKPNVDSMKEILQRKLDSRKAFRCFSLPKIEANPLTRNLLFHIVDGNRDSEEGFPVFSLLVLSWTVETEHFAQNFLNQDKTADLSLDAASLLSSLKPQHDAEGTIMFQTHLFSEFNRLLHEAETKKKQVVESLSAGKSVLRECLKNPQKVRLHLAALKEHQCDLKQEMKTLLKLPEAISSDLEREVKLFVWLAKAIQYSEVFAEEDTESHEFKDLLFERIPWDALIKLNEMKPVMIEGSADFARLLIRVKEVFESAFSWQEEVSKLTQLSMRGGKRRLAQTPDSNEADDSQQRIDLAEVAAMSHHPILKKVAMPREEAIHNMLENTKKFEGLLHGLLGTDYSGEHPDRIALPYSGSLMDEEGGFILLRLTGSPLYQELKSALEDIASVAADVLADTPGKATVDWISKAVDWIEALSLSIDRDNIGQGRLSIQKRAVDKLLKLADEMLLDVPDDLRKLLSQHGLFVSTNKDGRLTVKSKKGGAHHSIGTTAIRWSPVLFEALKQDASRTHEWEARTSLWFEGFHKFKRELSETNPDRQTVMKAHRWMDEIDDSLGEASELVIVPKGDLLDSAIRFQSELSDFLQKNSSADVDREFAQSLLEDDSIAAESRADLLDALVDRGIVTRRPIDPPTEHEQITSDFRAAARVFLGQALEEGIDNAAQGIDIMEEAGGLCKLKAWEIEEAVFNAFQRKSEDRMSPKYRDKVRSLRRAFVDPSNFALCLQVVSDDMDAEQLSKLSSEQLANPLSRRNKERLLAKAKEKTILTRSHTKSKPEPVAATSNQASSKKKNGTTDEGSDIDDSEGDKGVAVKSPDHAPSRRSLSRKSASSQLEPVAKNVGASSAPPPPPKSLALFSETRSSTFRVQTSSGTEVFSVSVGDQKFEVFLSGSSSLPLEVADMLPERMKDEGRTRVEELVKFLAEKKKNLNWKIHTVQVLPCADSDVKHYKRFYKEYERKQRIAMFKLGRGKLFLVTPKFHGIVKSLVELENDESTYAILLTRQ